jgi:hypothetical protein
VSEPILFRIPVGESAALGLALVDRSASGYLDAWQAPDGNTLPGVSLADYDAFSATWQCQVTSAALTASPNITTSDRSGTMCAPPGQSTVVGEDTFALELGYFQDPQVADGFSAFLYENRTKEAYFYFGADGDNPPRAIGRCRIVSGNIGGDTHTDLTATAPLPILRAPDIEFGTQGVSRIVLGAGTGGSTPPPAATGAVAGTPGAFTPAGSVPPTNLAALQSGSIVASPATAWTTGQYVDLGDSSDAYWDGDTWETGTAP